MQRYVAFLRAVNVAGHARVEMADVRRAFEAAGAREVVSVIQSGNVLFAATAQRARAVAEATRRKLAPLLGESPVLILRSAEELAGLQKSAPFPRHPLPREEKRYVVFLAATPAVKPRLPIVSVEESLAVAAVREHEVFVVSRRKPNGFYGFPNRFVEQAFGVQATSRNWTTIDKILERLAREAPA